MNTTPAYLIHSFPYSDSRIICRFYTLEFGHLSLIARKSASSKKQSSFQAFRPYEISFKGRGSLKTLDSCEELGTAFSLKGKRLYSAMYLNELMDRLVVEDGCNRTLYDQYELSIRQLSVLESDAMLRIEPVLRVFELSLLEECGFAIDFHYTEMGEVISEEAHYEYKEDSGFVIFEVGSLDIGESSKNARMPIHVFKGSSLLAISQRDFSDPNVMKAAKILLRKALTPLVGDKPIKSRELFISY